MYWIKIKKIIKFILIALIVNILAFLFFTINGYDMIYKFVKDFSVSETDITDEKSHEFLTQSYKTNLIYIYGEFPGVSSNYYILWENVKYLQNQYGLKYIIFDGSYAAGMWLNMYLKDQSVDIGGIINSAEFMNLIAEIIEYNEGLMDRDKLEFVGINPDESGELSIKYINYVFSSLITKRKPQIIAEVYNFDNRDLKEYCQNMYNSLLENERIYKEYFIDKYFPLYMTLRNYLYDNDRNVIRAENLTGIFNHNLRARYYGQLADISFIDSLKDRNNIFLSQLIYDNCESIYDGFEQYPYSLDDSNKPKVYILNNWILKYFEKYRAFVYKINNRPYESYDTTLGAKYIILTNSPAVVVIYD